MTSDHDFTPGVPDDGEYAPYYAGYIGEVEGRTIADLLRKQPGRLRAIVGDLSDADARVRYASGKWSIKEVVGHLGDAERVFAYRAFRIARGDGTPLAGFDENEYVAAGGFDDRRIGDLLVEFEMLRAGTLSLFAALRPEQFEGRGVVNGQEISVRALAHILAGHAEHHLGVLRDRYGLREGE